jgi:hypothetical protein
MTANVLSASDISVQKEILSYDDDSFFVHELGIYTYFSLSMTVIRLEPQPVTGI